MQGGFRKLCGGVATVLVLAACGGGDGGSGYGGPITSPNGSGSPGTPSTSNAVAVSDNQFTPSAVQVAVGTTVTWTWGANRSEHNVTFADGVASPTQGNNATYSRTFSSAGVFNYQCTLHPGMSGTVTVK